MSDFVTDFELRVRGRVRILSPITRQAYDWAQDNLDAPWSNDGYAFADSGDAYDAVVAIERTGMVINEATHGETAV